MKRPAFQFYPGDWLRSTDLRSCSVGARGLWIDMICLMHEGNPYGHLKVGSKVVLPTVLARVVGADLADVETWLTELRDAGVCSLGDDGCYLSRRMIRDEEIRQVRASGGKKSLDNPNVPRPKDSDKGILEGSPSPPSLGGSPASALASSSSSSSSEQDQKQKPARAPRLPDDRFAQFWTAYPRKVAKEAAAKTWKKLSPDQPLFEEIMAGLVLAKASAGWTKDAGQFIPHAATWLNGRRWTDRHETGIAVGGSHAARTGGRESALDRARRENDEHRQRREGGGRTLEH